MRSRFMDGRSTVIRAADFIGPVGTLWVNAIRMTVIPLVASLLVAAVGSTGDVHGAVSVQCFPIC
jgi:Na+/H+-dicarboxylate symporter